MHTQCERGGCWFDKRVAVTIAANPGPEVNESARYCYACFGCLAGRAINTVYCLFQISIGFRDGIEQAHTKKIQAVADLIFDRGFVDAHFIGLPQHLYLLLDGVTDFVAFIATDAPV